MKYRYYVKCPQCGNNDNFENIKIDRFKGIWRFILIPAPFLCSTYKRLRCPECKFLFKKPPVPQTALAKLANIVIGIIAISIFIPIIFSNAPDLLKIVSENNLLLLIENFIHENSKSVTIGFLFICFTVPVFILISLISNFTLHQRIKKDYETAQDSKKN